MVCPSIYTIVTSSLLGMIFLTHESCASAFRFACIGGSCNKLDRQRAPQPLSAAFVDFWYQPSRLEVDWEENVEDWQSSKHFCNHVQGYKQNITYWLETTAELMSTDRLRKPVEAGGGVFSSFSKRFKCQGQSHHLVSWIEPLAFCLRHPYAPCIDYKWMENRGYLMLMSQVELDRLSCGTGPVRKFFFDLGASTWSSGLGGASQKWFVEAYARRGIKFDRMLLWEARPHKADEIFAEVPDEILHTYQYINLPVTTEKNSPANPLNILKALTTHQDFVVLKIDIDNTKVEMELIEQLLNDQEVYSRVDEFFFEHHVNFPPMLSRNIPDGNGWDGQSVAKNQYLSNSYQLFQSLRSKGIRAHGWP